MLTNLGYCTFISSMQDHLRQPMVALGLPHLFPTALAPSLHMIATESTDIAALVAQLARNGATPITAPLGRYDG
jgi:hypothetical protein